MSEDTMPGISLNDLDKLLKKKQGTVFHDLEGVKPTEFISTDSLWLDAVICRGRMGGIPRRKITEIAGLESTGKSFLALHIAKNAQRDYNSDVIYFDSEHATDDINWLKRIGVNLDKFRLVWPNTLEETIEMMETIMKNGGKNILFIWDSLANMPSELELAQDVDEMNPTKLPMAVKARVLKLAIKRISNMIYDNDCTLVVCDQLITNLPGNTYESKLEAQANPLITAGGKATKYIYNLRIFLEKPDFQKWHLIDEEEHERIGSTVKVNIKKSRFGSEGREIQFQIAFAGDNIGILDEASWYTALEAKGVIQTGAWNTLNLPDGIERKFRRKEWVEFINKEEGLKEKVVEELKRLYIYRYDSENQ